MSRSLPIVCSLLLLLGGTAVAQEATPGDPAQSPFVVAPAEREVFVSPDGATQMSLMINEQSVDAANAAMSLIVAAPGAVVPVHVHETSSEILYVIEGGGELLLAGEAFGVEAGQSIYIPANTPHGYRNDGTTTMRAVQVYVGPGPEARFRSWSPAEAID